MNEYNPILNIPYPIIKVNQKNPKLAYKILNLYSGKISEYTAISQYSFQSFCLEKYKELSYIIEEISKVEMRHLKILALLIKKLGLIPYFVTYENNIPKPWNSDYVNFTTDYRNMLISNIESEKKAIIEYNKIIKETNDKNIINIINRIIKDEERHIEIFNSLLYKYDNDK